MFTKALAGPVVSSLGLEGFGVQGLEFRVDGFGFYRVWGFRV